MDPTILRVYLGELGLNENIVLVSKSCQHEFRVWDVSVCRHNTLYTNTIQQHKYSIQGQHKYTVNNINIHIHISVFDFF